MRKVICLLLSMVALTVNAQMLKGDMNGDGKLDVADVVASVGMVLGQQEQTYIQPFEIIDPYMVDNSLLAGTWYKSKTETVTFNADGTTDYPDAEGYRYQPYLGRVLLLGASGLPCRSVEVAYAPGDTLILDYQLYTKEAPVYKVSTITLSETAITLKRGMTQQLTATVLPEDADDKSVTWTSGNEQVATVNDGLVTATAPGTTTITCSSMDGGATATCKVTVPMPVMVSYLELSAERIMLESKGTRTLTVTVYPEDAEDPSVTWTSSDETIATVSGGTVVAKKKGTATISCIANDGSDATETCTVLVREDMSGMVNGHESVDLGLTSCTLWATCNVGATKPEEYGGYYSWGETETKENYLEIYYSFYDYGQQDQLTKYCTQNSYSYNGRPDYKTRLDEYDDVAYVTWGEDWNIPSVKQLEELYKECKNEWTTRNGVNGYLVTGPSGKSIFFPAAGYNWTYEPDYTGTRGLYWANTINNDVNYKAYNWEFSNNENSIYPIQRCRGLSVRPVITYYLSWY